MQGSCTPRRLRRFPIILVGFSLWMLAQCAPAAGERVNTPLAPTPISTVVLNNATATTAQANPTNTPAPPIVLVAPPLTFTPSNPIPLSGTSMSKAPPRNTTEAAQQLVQALELALNEMRVAQTSDSLQAAQTHSQASLNVLVGQYGRWYSTRKNDPSNGLGVLPGEIQPQGGADLDGPPQPTSGLALLTMGTSTTPSPELTTLLGDVKLWRSKPRAGYDTIANAVNSADTTQIQLGKLEGSVPRAVGWQRLALAESSSVNRTRAFVAQAIGELEIALESARALAR
ncbi:MAG: hypothetical protein HY741_10145 [Chloroflexi bacterium]|nr:hypothetical protein [Chloroflexota bacterium]